MHRVPPRSISALDGALLALVLPLILLATHDVAGRVPPLADDWWMIHEPPGHLLAYVVRELGWAARPLGAAWMDLVGSLTRALGVPLVLGVYVVRAVTLAAVYLALRGLFACERAVALAATTIVAFTPAAPEAWTMLCNVQLQFGMAFAAVVCGIYYRLLERDVGGGESRASAHEASARLRPAVGVRWLSLAAAVQLVGLAHYDQAVLSIPAFVSVLALYRALARALRWRHALAVVGTSAGTSIAWLLAITGSGFAGTYRSFGSGAPPAHWTDLTITLERVWHAFVLQHLWRVIEFTRLRTLPWTADSAAAVVAVLATIMLLALLARMWLSGRRGAPHGAAASDVRRSSPIVFALASLTAVVSAILPQALGLPGVPNVSRMFYIPGLFVALALVPALELGRRHRPVLAGAAVVLFVLWSVTLTRRYIADLRLAGGIVRTLASAVAATPPGDGGVLVIAPGVVGTFGMPAVQAWSFPDAVLELHGARSARPLYFTEDCEQARLAGGIEDEAQEPVEGAPWSEVLVHRAGRVARVPNLATACPT